MPNYQRVLIDDLRSFKEPQAEDLILRSLEEATAWLIQLNHSDTVQELWLDHDLGLVAGEKETIMPFVNELEKAFFFEQAPLVGRVFVHTSNSVGGSAMVAALKNYVPIQRVYAGDFFTVEEL